MQVDDPPYLSVGTAVSAKYKGAFCEAKVSKVVRIVKCKVTYKMGLGNATVSDEQIKGTLRVGQLVQAKHPDKKEFIDATITKIQDCSQYTVVFDDGDITTLKRTALCLKSGRHFNESETLDQLPLTHPEHFGNPVVGGRRGRRNRHLKEDSSDGEMEEENEPDLEGYQVDIGRVVSVEATDKKRSKDNWFPGLVVIPSAQPTVRINVKDEYLVRSFKDGRYYTVPKKEVSDFNRDLSEKVESSVLLEAVQKALKYLDNSELPIHWERSSLFNLQNLDSDSEENLTDSSDDEPCEEKDRFVAQLYKFMDEAGTPLNKTPTVNNKDVDLHRLFRIVHKMGGYNRVTNQNKWRSVTLRLHLPNNQNTFNQVKSIYKKCLLSYEAFHRTLGVTMLNHTRSTKKNRGRSLIRDKDRSTPVNNSPRPDKEDEVVAEKKEEVKEAPPPPPPPPVVEPVKPIKRKSDVKKDVVSDVSDTNSSDPMEQCDANVSSGPSKEPGRPKRAESKILKERKAKSLVGEKTKSFVEKFDEQTKKEEEDKSQLTRSKSQTIIKQKEKDTNLSEKKYETKVRGSDSIPSKPLQTKAMKKGSDEEKKRGRRRVIPEDKTSNSDSSTTDSITTPLSNININIGDKLKVYYGPTHESKVTYEAKVIEIDKDNVPVLYLVHYTGWNTRYDEWITSNRIAENLSATTKAKRLKQGNSAPNASKGPNPKMPTKRGRGMSITGRSTAPEVPRSTTPSSVTSSSSRTKSPATPATRSTSRLTKSDVTKRSRRTSAHTDTSIHSDSETDLSESETELSRTRSGGKNDEPEIKTYKRKIKSQNNPKTDKNKEKDDIDVEKDSDCDKQPKRQKKGKISPEKSGEESEDETNPPKGRDFDLNQIRSELKGFTKALKVSPLGDSSDKDGISSSDDSTNHQIEKSEEDDKKIKVEEKPSCSEDIYEFKEPEPFEFEARPPSKLADDLKKRIVPRLYDDIDKSPSKKKVIKSPEQNDDTEKKRFKRIPPKQEDSEDEEIVKKDEDPFDKLVESPSYNIRKPINEKIEPNPKTGRNILDEPLFRDISDSIDDYNKELILSDNESQAQNIFARAGELFSDSYAKSSPDRGTMDLEFPLKPYEKLKDSDDNEDDLIREQIERVIQQNSSTDDDSSDTLLIKTPTTSYQAKKREDTKIVPIKLEEIVDNKPVDIPQIHIPEIKKDEPLNINVAAFTVIKQISPALQETDSTLLASICSQKVLIPSKLEDTKEVNVKTGTKIADSLLQKLKRVEIKPDESENAATSDMELEPELTAQEIKIETNLDNKYKAEQKSPLQETKKFEVKTKTEKYQPVTETRKRRKAISRQFILESDSDSSDSEQLVIARSDEDSQTRSLDPKVDAKESDSNLSRDIPTTDDSQPQQEERNFKFEEIKQEPMKNVVEDVKKEPESLKEEEPDSQLHSLLLCEETLPRSPAPVTETPVIVETKPPKAVLEMPFASAPGTSNSKSILLEHKNVIKVHPNVQQPIPPPPPPQPVPPAAAAAAMVLMANERPGNAAAVLDNTPPTTPESSISNLSPRGDNDNLSPNTVDNESCKSNEPEHEYLLQRRNSTNKVTPYSEEDTQMTGETSAMMKKTRDDCPPVVKKRRKSLRGTEDVPAKRGRKPLNRSRHNSDSDDTSEHSNTGSINIGIYDRNQRSPRPSKYNFFVEFDPSLDSGQRIAVLQQKLSELRKTYADVKSELAAVERRRKKIKRREREAQKASKQEMVCA